MNTRLGKSFGLAFVVAVGILALMFALGTFNAQKVGAQGAGELVHAGTITVDPNDPAPGATGTFTVTFRAENDIKDFENLDVELEGFTVPTSIETTAIHIRLYDNKTEKATSSKDAGFADDVSVSGNVITLSINYDTDDKRGIDIVKDTWVDLVFRQRAGLVAPAQAGTYAVSVAEETTTTDDAVTVSPALSIDPAKGGGSTEITVSGKAFADGTGTLWREILTGPDTNGDQIPDQLIVAPGVELAELVVPTNKETGSFTLDTDGDGEANFDLRLEENESGIDDDEYVPVTKDSTSELSVIKKSETESVEELVGYTITLGPAPVDPATTPVKAYPTIPDVEYDKTDELKDVTVTDGAFSTTVGASDLATGGMEGRSIIRIADADGGMNREVFQLTGTMAVASDSANKGTRVTIELSDWIDDDPRAVRIGGELIPTDDVKHLADDDKEEAGFPTNVKAAGQATIYAKVTETVGLGSKTVVLFRDALGTDRIDGTSIEITANALNLTPTTVVPGQEVTITGSGFSGTGGTVASGGIEVGDNDAMNIEVSVTSGGQAAGTFVVPAADPGSVTVEMNHNGKTGQAQLTVLEPTITLDPETSRQNTVVRVSGTGFVAASPVTITYDSRTAGSSMTDSVGSWSTQIRVPNNDSFINNTQDVKAVSNKTDFDAVSDTVEHSVPNASLDLSHDTVNSGDTVTISGEGFPRFANVKVGFDTAPETTIGRTDGEGDFTATAVVPGMDPGTYLLRVKVDGDPNVDTSVLFNVTATPISTTQASADAFADLVTADNLIVVWHFDNTTKDWSFYDPRPAVAAAVDLKMVSTGDNVWVQITADQTFQGEMLTAGWNLVTLD